MNRYLEKIAQQQDPVAEEGHDLRRTGVIAGLGTAGNVLAAKVMNPGSSAMHLGKAGLIGGAIGLGADYAAVKINKKLDKITKSAGVLKNLVTIPTAEENDRYRNESLYKKVVIPGAAATMASSLTAAYGLYKGKGKLADRAGMAMVGAIAPTMGTSMYLHNKIINDRKNT